MLRGRKIVLGVTGGIAAYKTAYLVRRLVEREAQVQVVMTGNAKRFITPLTLATLSGRPVYSDMWSEDGEFPETDIRHISLADWADLVAVAPATANLIGKFANGIAEDLLSTTLITVTCPVLVCPAMSTTMYQHPIVQGNLARLRDAGVQILAPEAGELACRKTGPGRLPEPETIADRIEKILSE